VTKGPEEERVIDELRDKLRVYLIGQGVKINGNMFRCINPSHEDKTPSCSIGGHVDEQIFHCFSASCGVAGDIFTAAHFLENLPVHGVDFYNYTLPELAKRFGINYDPKVLNEDQKAILILKRAYHDAAYVVNSFVLRDWDKSEQPNHITIIKKRGIEKRSVIDFTVGAIPSIEEYKRAMIVKGWSEGYLNDNHLLERETKEDKIFEPGKIIMPICNHNGEPVAFVSRKDDWEKDKVGAKYVNTTTTPIYHKANILYGLHLARNSIKRRQGKVQTKPLYVVEGYIDTIMLRQAGLRNACGLGSAAFNTEVLDMLSKYGKIEIKDLILAFDGDDSGTECTRRALEDLAKRSNVTVLVKQLPKVEEYHDPDEIIKKRGLKAFLDIENFTPFKWTQKDAKDSNLSEEDFVGSACRIIAKESSPLKRISMSKELEDLTTEFSLNDIIEEINTVRGRNNARLGEELSGIFDDMVRKKKNTRVNVMDILSESFSKAKQVSKDYLQRQGDTHEIYKSNISTVRTHFTTTADVNGFKLNTFSKLEDMFRGWPSEECLIAVAGRPNSGKSTWCRELSWDIAKSNPNSIVVYMSIDDSVKDVLQAIVAREANESRDKVIRYSSFGEAVKEKIDLAWEKVMSIDNYIVTDSTQGSTVMHMQDHIDYVKRNYPKKKPIVFLDNFHKLRTSDNTQLREKFVNLSQTIKDITLVENIPIVMTVELRKTNDGRISMDDIAETVQISYDCKVVLFMNQELNNNLETGVVWFRDNYGTERQKMPYLDIRIMKNKHNEKKCRLGYRFETDKSILHEVDWSEIEGAYKKDADTRRRESKSNFAF
jgi:DNA primase